MSIAFEKSSRTSVSLQRYTPIRRVNAREHASLHDFEQDVISVVSLLFVVTIIAMLFWQQ